jgi:transposase-like protein
MASSWSAGAESCWIGIWRSNNSNHRSGQNITPELQEVLRLRKELARLRPHQTGRIVEKDHVLKERILTGSL